MDCYVSATLRRPTCVSPRVTYWTGIWEPQREAISKEVALLRSHLSPGSPVVSFTPQSSRLVLRERVLRLNYRRWIPLRAAALAIERLGDVTHMFGGLDAAHFLLVLGRRPLLFTVVLPGTPQALELYERAATFVAESRGLARALIDAGVAAERVHVIYPGIDLRVFVPALAPSGPFRLLFASTPADPLEIDARGLGLLIELARVRPEIEIEVLWRRWGAVHRGLEEIARRHPPGNFKVIVGDLRTMHQAYRQVHATVCCFEAGHGKSAPNSIIEGLATGRPVLLTETCGIADLVRESDAGVVTGRSVEALASGIDELRSRYGELCAGALRLAGREFDQRMSLARYGQIYRDLAAQSCRSAE
jgi:glycosyltransferase involved in cell wall biosynthesis